MPVQPSPPATGTGNPLSDANSVPPPQQRLQGGNIDVATALNKLNQDTATVASDCLWPPSAQVTVPIIPGVYSQSFQLGCLLTYSQARAVVAAGIIVGGLLITWGGLTFFAVAEALPWAAGVLGVRTGGKAAAAVEKTPAAAQKAATKTDVAPAA
jgi:hypothetical protein